MTNSKILVALAALWVAACGGLRAAPDDAGVVSPSGCKVVAYCPAQGCDNNEQCCGGLVCGQNACVAPTGVCCGTSSECLSASCVGGACACSRAGDPDGSVYGDLAYCHSEADCCDGISCILTGGDPGICCNLAGRPCSNAAQCCSGTCTAGRCDCQPIQAGGPGYCASNSDCCNGYCNSGGCELFSLGMVCAIDSECYSNDCRSGQCCLRDDGGYTCH